MRKFLSFIAAVITLGLVSCSSDDSDGTSSSSLDIVGSWYEEAENEEMRLNENGTFYDKYCNVLRSGETEGRWEYDKANRKLTETFFFMGQTQYNDFTVRNLTENGFTISSENIGNHKFEKIVETYNLTVGATATIKYTNPAIRNNNIEYGQSSTYSPYKSNNERIASVTADGKITAEGEKGTTYIKIPTGNGNVWVKVVVGDECLDLWYDYPSLMGTDIASVRNILGIPSVNGDDGYSFGYVLSLNDYADEIDIFLDEHTGLVDQMALVIKKDIPESLLLNYLKSHYYPSADLGSEFYTTSSTIEKSISVVYYDKAKKVVRFYASDMYRIPDRTCDFGLTTNEIVKKYGELLYGVLPMYDVNSIYVSTIYYTIDKNTNKVTAFQYTVRENISPNIINKHLSAQYNLIASEGNMYGYGDGDSRNTSRIWIVYNADRKNITFFDQDNYGKSAN